MKARFHTGKVKVVLGDQMLWNRQNPFAEWSELCAGGIEKREWHLTKRSTRGPKSSQAIFFFPQILTSTFFFFLMLCGYSDQPQWISCNSKFWLWYLLLIILLIIPPFWWAKQFTHVKKTVYWNISIYGISNCYNKASLCWYNSCSKEITCLL